MPLRPLDFVAGFAAGLVGAASLWKLLSWRCLILPDPDDVPVLLGDTAYRVKRIDAPAASGLALRILSLLLGARGSLLAQLVCRSLMNRNGTSRLRCLAGQIMRKRGTQAMYYPLVRLSQQRHAEHERLAKVAEEVRKRPCKYNSVLDFHAAFKSGASTPAAVLERVLAAVNRLPLELRVFRELADRDALRRAAAESGERYAKGMPLSPFDGVPVAFKDMCAIAGMTTTCGTHASHGLGFSAEDELVVARLRQVGALVLGLNVMTEFGVTPLGYSLHSRAPVNAYDPERYAGGSSSGSAVGAALGLFPVSLGFDGGGSIRIPAAMEGVVGLKCTWGRVATQGEVLYATVAAGPIAGCAADAALFYEVIAQPAPEHFYSRLYGSTPLPPPHCFGFNSVDDLSDLRIGVYRAWVEDCHPEVLARTEEVLVYLQQKGATVLPVEIPNLEVMALAHGSDISIAFALDHEEQRFRHPGTLEPSTHIQLALGGSFTGCESASCAWIRAYAMEVVDELFEGQRLSCLFTPTMGALPPRMPAAAKRTGESNTTLVMQLVQFIFLGNLCGNPAISVPAGLSGEGAPIGVQVLARHWEEHICLRVANALDIPAFRTWPPGFVDLLRDG